MRKLLLDAVDRISVGWMRHAPGPLAHGYAGLMARWVAPRLYPRGDRYARQNLPLLRPDLPVEPAMRAMWDNLTRSFLEVPRARQMYDEGRVETLGAEHLATRPLMVNAIHLGNWEMVGLAMVRHSAPPTAIYQPPASSYRHDIIVRERIAGGGRLLPVGRDAARPAMGVLKSGQVLLFSLDEHQHGRVAAPSLGRGPRQGGNIQLSARLARLSGAPVVIAHCIRLPPRDGPRFRVTFAPPLHLPRTADRVADIAAGTAMLDAAIEPIILQHLPQWLMLHEWRPEG
ncbi:MAG: lipid biosynthesis lauroyl acyltransferase [Belnapia sp.]|nr:lipid biosynthesis lauroyl acyltransferase [Belnapia sp.]